MSLVKTLAKVAVGVAVAKAASGMMKGGARADTPGQSGGLGGLLEGLAKGQQGGGSGPFGGAHSPSQRGGGGLEDMLGGILGGAGGQQGGAGGGLGGLLEQLGGGARGGAGGGLGDLIGGLAGGAGAGGTLGEIAGALKKAASGGNDRSFGDVLNSQFEQSEPEPIQPSADQEAAAALMLRAMIQATKADGELDAAEKEKLIGRLGGDVDQSEAQFVQSELQRPVDIEGLARDTPKGMEPQIYAMSVMGIDLDSQAEAQYLHQLAQALGLNAQMVNNVHSQLGVPALYS